MDNKMIFACNTKDQIAMHLARDYEIEYWDSFEETEVNPKGLLLDFVYYSEFKMTYDAMIDYCIIKRIPIVFLNIMVPDYLFEKFGLGFKSKAIVVRPYADFDVFDTVDLQYETKVNPTILYLKHREPISINPSDKLKYFYNNNTPGNMARRISSIINSTFSVPIGSLDKPDVPENQYKKIFLNIIRNTQISNASSQRCYNNTTLEINLFASFEPKAKYLQIRTLGEGINPGMLSSNCYMERGWFQGDFDIKIEPSSKKVSILSHEPKDKKSVDSYVAEAKLMVGVDVVENPSFSSTVEVNSIATSELEGFMLDNKTDRNSVQWYWVMDLLRGGLFNISCNGRKSVRELPKLAVSTLNSLTDTVWYVDKEFQDIVELDVKLEETLLYASTNVPEEIEHLAIGSINIIKQIYGHYGGQSLNIDFDIVHP